MIPGSKQREKNRKHIFNACMPANQWKEMAGLKSSLSISIKWADVGNKQQ